MASEGLHEAPESLSADVVDRHRAIRSIMEELEAVDWYDQRVSATSDPTLAEVLAHNRDEEKEHAAMTIEWLRRHDPVFDGHLRTYVFSEGSIVAVERAAEHGADPTDAAPSGPPSPESPESSDPPDAPDTGSLGIGSLRGSQR